MIGLIKKDLLLIKSNLKSLLLIFVLFIFMSFNGVFDITFLLPFICIMLFISTFSYDDFNHWNAYASCLPCGRENVVKSKYLATFLLTIFVSLLGVCLSILIGVSKESLDMEAIVSSILGCFVAICIMIAIMYPLLFKYGSEKGRIVLFTFIFAVSIIGGLLIKVVDASIINRFVEILDRPISYVVIPLLFLGIVIISYFISKRIYLKKEF